MTAPSRQLPKGQRPLAYFPRIGLPRYVARRVSVPAEPSLRIGGEVALPCELPLAELESVPRRDQVSDFHCVITWSRLGLRWGGRALRDVYEQLIVPRARPSGSVRYLKFVGADGFYASLALDFALADDVLLADALDGEPLPLKHGAPLRLVAPDADSRREPRPGRRGGLYEFARRVLATKRGKQLYLRRQGSVESVFGQIKANRGVRRFQRRGRLPVRSEWRLLTATHNLLKLHQHSLAIA